MTYFPPTTKMDDLPGIMPSPFNDVPHPLAAHAAELLQQQLTSRQDIPRDFFAENGGKMFGILVVQNDQGCIGFLSAFSGMMNGQWLIDGFVPPIFDVEEQAAFLTQGKQTLVAFAEELRKLEEASEYVTLQENNAHILQQRSEAHSSLKREHKAAKAVRKQQRLTLASLPPDEQHHQMRALAIASQQHKREAAAVKLEWDTKVKKAQAPLDEYEQKIESIKSARAKLSRELHQQVFDSYQLCNFLGEQKTVTHFFEDSTPPAGAGDCAAPKLIHYAQSHQLKPIALAEFWWGESPAAGVRHHKLFYPACRGKCRPILPFMLSGLDVEPEPYFGNDIDERLPEVIFEDDVLMIINKPAGLMSEPGKDIKDCVFNRLLERYPELPELRLVHRLDMSTSGLLLVAKDRTTYHKLQRQFIQRTVEKRYEAVLCKALPADMFEGEINLPLRVDFYDRPRQLVCYEYGKTAQTHWNVIQRSHDTTRVYFYPHTGRTHQLRVHAAHKDGLNAAIVGDELYGLAGERLNLHAQRLCFDHPVSRKRLIFEVPAPF